MGMLKNRFFACVCFFFVKGEQPDSDDLSWCSYTQYDKATTEI